LAEVARSEHELESVLRHVTRERRSPDSSFASLPPISSRVLAARPTVRQQPVWKLRAERTAAAVGLTALATVMIIAVALWLDWETPYRVIAKPLESRIHLGKDSDNSTVSKARALPAPAVVHRKAPARRAAAPNPSP